MKSEAYGGFMIKAYTDSFDKVTFGKTKNRAMISRIVWLRDYVLSYMEKHGIYANVHEQPQITRIINNNLVTEDNYKTWFTPNEKMIDILVKHENEQLLCKLDDDYFFNRN